MYWYPTFMDPVEVTRSYARTGHWDGKGRVNYVLVTGAKVTGVVLEEGRAVGGEVCAGAGEGGGKLGGGDDGEGKEGGDIGGGGGAYAADFAVERCWAEGVLERAGVKVVQELPGVGSNFQDHNSISAAFNCESRVFWWWWVLTMPVRNVPDPRTNASFNTWASAAWAANRTGPNSIATRQRRRLAVLPRHLVLAQPTSPPPLLAQNHSAHLPADTHLTVLAGYAAQMRALAAALQSNGTAFYNLVQTGGGSTGMLVDLHPLSRGSVNIDPRDPANREPLVDYRALSNPLDAVIIGDIGAVYAAVCAGQPDDQGAGAERVGAGGEGADG